MTVTSIYSRRVKPVQSAERERSIRLSEDPRYRNRRWRQRTRPVVLARDGWRCYVPGCTQRGIICDHIIPVYEGMPDSLFYSLDNLRAACRYHNYQRGVIARAEREGTVFLTGDAGNHSPLANLSPRHGPRRRDYSRRVPSGSGR